MYSQKIRLKIGMLGLSILTSLTFSCQKQIEVKTDTQEKVNLELANLKSFLAQQIKVSENDLYFDYADSTIVHSQTGLREKISVVRNFYKLTSDVNQF